MYQVIRMLEISRETGAIRHSTGDYTRNHFKECTDEIYRITRGLEKRT